MFKPLLNISGISLLLAFSPPLWADPQTSTNRPELGGSMQAIIDGKVVQFPSLKTDIHADIQGDLATVTVRQTFTNPSNIAVNSRYLFPLNQNAAVYEMVMEVGEETIQAKIERIEEAKQQFAQAQADGKTAALLEQHRPNMFTQDLANLMPGLPITTTLRYTQTVPKQDGDYELVIPLIVGPRYQSAAGTEPQPATEGDKLNPTATTSPTVSSRQGFGQWELTATPQHPPTEGVDLPNRILSDRVTVKIDLHAGLPINQASSDSHTLSVNSDLNDHWQIQLAEGQVLDNRDFVLRYQLAGKQVQPGLLSHQDGENGYFSLLIEPPALPSAAQIGAREMVFVLDCSGSMSGQPMNASKAFMSKALRALRPSDHFRIIRFSDAATEFSSQPLAATPRNITAGLAYVQQLSGSGGTEMSSGIRQALTVPLPANSNRIVTFLTDGYIGHEAHILSLINEHIGSARLFALGVGSATNRYLLDEMARAGRGFAQYLDPTADLEEVTTALANRLQSPVLTQIGIDWGGLKAYQVIPAQVPDLYAGQSIRILGRYTQAGQYTIKLHGLAGQKQAVLPLQITLPDPKKAGSTDGKAIALNWARGQIGDYMRQLNQPPHSRLNTEFTDTDTLKSKVTQLGLDYSLMTRWTSFIAVSDQVYNTNPNQAVDTQVPLPMPAGVSPEAYGGQGFGGFFGGSSTPEPETWLGLALLASMGGLRWWRHARATHFSK